MKVISINPNDATNSVTGFTLSIFFSGCSHKCNGCFSPQTWNYDAGDEYSLEDLKQIILESRHKNVSLIGGDPFFHLNRKEVVELIEWVKVATTKKIYVWTGYTKSEVQGWVDPEVIDYLIDGKFELALKDIRLTLRGSSNQKIYKQGKLVEL